MKHLILVTDTWSPEVNGVVIAFQKVSEVLTSRGWNVTVIHPGLFRTIPSILIPEMRVPLFFYKAFSKIVEESAPDYIHIATEGPLGLAGRWFCSRRKFPFTTSYHTNFDLYTEARLGLFSSPVTVFMRNFHKAARRTMVATPSLRTMLEKSGYEHLAIWPLGVDTEFFRRNEQVTSVSFKHPVFLYVGRVAPEKGVEEFLQCKLTGTKIVVGDGPQLESLKERYRNEAVFMGFMRGQELVDCYSIADALVFPSRTDTFGLVILESLACGVPVAAHDVIGPRDIITPGVDGFLDEHLASAAEKCLALSKDACRKTALGYSWESSADAFVKNLVPIASSPRTTKEAAG